MEAREFGEYLKELRKKKKLTIRQLDTYSGVSHSYISQMERGERGVPKPEILQKLSKPLGVKYEELMGKAGYLITESNIFDKGPSIIDDIILKSIYDVSINEIGEVNIILKSTPMQESPNEQKLRDLDDETKEFILQYLISIAAQAAPSNVITLPTEQTESRKNEIFKKYESLSEKKRKMIDNMLEVLESDE